VRALGTKSNRPMLQLMVSVPGKLAEYLDLDGGGQTVIYVEKFPHCPGLMEVEGVVMEVTGPASQPAGQADTPYSELHIDVSRYRCLD
jgi:hypothetical protein